MDTGMADEFRKDAVRIALTSGLSRRQVAAFKGNAELVQLLCVPVQTNTQNLTGTDASSDCRGWRRQQPSPCRAQGIAT